VALPNRFRKLIPAVTTFVVASSLWFIGQNAVAVTGASSTAAAYKFTEAAIALPPGYNNQHMNDIRQVNPAYEKIRSWISSVGAGISINDVTGHGRADGMCIVDTRTNEVIVTYTPDAVAADQFTPFILDASPLPMDATMAPTGCVPGDYLGDGRRGFLVTYLGRTPIMFLPRSTAETPSVGAYQPQELVPEVSLDGKYHGPRWNTDAAYVGALDGTGRPDIIIGNYFPDSAVLDPNGQNDVMMNDSMSSAENAGGDYVLQWAASQPGPNPSVQYSVSQTAIPHEASMGWALAISGADMTGDGLPEIYIANDFGHGHLLYNTSTPGAISFKEAKGQRTPTTPKSFVLGNGSFKGMGVDFGDIDHNGSFDMVVSAITVPYGIEESNYVYVNKAADPAAMQKSLAAGVAPFDQKAQEYGLAWTGWAWDVKFGDFLNSGKLDVLQTDGFIKGKVDRWNWAQELATTNDDLLSNPAMWPNMQPGDDLSGDEAMAFYAKNSSGTYVNVSSQLGLAVPTPTRGIATGDPLGNGVLDFAVARQWGPPAYYVNNSPKKGNALELELYRPSSNPDPGRGLAAIGSPAYGATVTVTAPGQGTQISELDGGGGHDSYRSFDVHFGLADYSGPVTATIQWNDAGGKLHKATQQMTQGTHSLMLTDVVQEVSR
jgi:hypothetical protein